MFNFSKSRLDSDLQNKTAVQYKIMVDWLRSIHNQNIRLSLKITDLSKRVDSLLEDEGLPDDIEISDNDNSSTTGVLS